MPNLVGPAGSDFTSLCGWCAWILCMWWARYICIIRSFQEVFSHKDTRYSAYLRYRPNVVFILTWFGGSVIIIIIVLPHDQCKPPWWNNQTHSGAKIDCSLLSTLHSEYWTSSRSLQSFQVFSGSLTYRHSIYSFHQHIPLHGKNPWFSLHGRSTRAKKPSRGRSLKYRLAQRALNHCSESNSCTHAANTLISRLFSGFFKIGILLCARDWHSKSPDLQIQQIQKWLEVRRTLSPFFGVGSGDETNVQGVK